MPETTRRARRARTLLHSSGFRAAVSNLRAAMVAVVAPLFLPLAAMGQTITAWGKANEGQLTVPAGMADVIAVAADARHTIALKADGTVAGWGLNDFDQTTVPAGLVGVVAIAAGEVHSLALKADGTVASWGTWQYGVTAVPAGLTDAVAIDAGRLFSLALKADGRVTAWGINNYGQTTVPPGLAGVVAIAAGESHSLALKSNGTVSAWGNNDQGQTNVPADLAGVVAIAAGCDHCLALKTDGTVVAWGANGSGQSTVPADLAGVTAVAAGGYHSLALREDGIVVAWGNNSWAQGTVPAELTTVFAIAAGELHSVALSDPATGPPVLLGPAFAIAEAEGSTPEPVQFTHRLRATGAPTSYSASGLPPGLSLEPATGLISGTPTALGKFTVTIGASNNAGTTTGVLRLTVNGLPRPVDLPPRLTLGTHQSLVLSATHAGTWTVSGLPPGIAFDPATQVLSGQAREAGVFDVEVTLSNFYGTTQTTWRVEIAAVAAWGSNYSSVSHAEGGTFTGQSFVPPDLTEVVALAAGDFHTVALNADGRIAVWGGGPAGPFYALVGLPDAVAIAAGSLHSVVLRRNETVVAWGDNSYGQSTVPAGLTGVVAVAGGRTWSVALKSDGTVVAWGQITQGHSLARLGGVVAITARHALKSDGSVVELAGYAPGAVVAGLSNVVAIAAGAYHSLALKADGTVAAWGANSNGQTAVPAGLAGVVAIAAGTYHSIALKADGTVVVWGRNTAGQTAVPTGLGGAVAIAAGSEHSLALVSAGGERPRLLGPFRAVTEAAGSRVGLMPFRYRISSAGSPTVYAAAGLPAGLSLDPETGVITGAPTAVGTFEVALSASDATSTASATLRLTVNGTAKPVDLPSSLGLGAEQSLVLESSYAGEWSVTGLPSGLAFDPLTRTLSGSATEIGSHPVTIRITNDYGSTETIWPLDVSPVVSWGQTWGAESYGKPPSGLRGIVAIATGDFDSLALRTDGTVVSWGAGFEGAGPPDLKGAVAIAAGSAYSLALPGDGTVMSAGYTEVPPGLVGVVGVAAGSQHALALKYNGTVAAWGTSDEFGQLAVPAGLRNVTGIAAGRYHSLAVKSDGTVAAWGAGSPGTFSWAGYGQSTVPSGLRGVVAVAAGGSHSLALKADGTVVAWGAGEPGKTGVPDFGQSTVPPGLTGVVAIAAGAHHSLALKADGTVVAWGAGAAGTTGAYDTNQSAVPAGLRGVVAIAASSTHSLALSTDRPILRGSASLHGSVGLAFSHQLSVSVARNPPEFIATGLPPGLSLDAAGLLSGTPTLRGVYIVDLPHLYAGIGTAAALRFTIIGADEAGLAAYSAWSSSLWAPSDPETTPEADPDGDGVRNLAEFATGTDPRVPDGSPIVVRHVGGPPGRLELEIDVPVAAAEVLVITAEFSVEPDFGPDRVETGISPASEPPPAGFVRMRFVDPAPIPPAQRFGRLRITLPPSPDE